MENQGFIKLNRKFFENALWKEPRQYSRSEAWLDLIQMARFEDSNIILNNRAIEVQRGEIAVSRRLLENRWSWGSTKVSNFLGYLKKSGMINQRQTSGQTIIRLCNYDTYNAIQTNGKSENKPTTNQRQTTGKPLTNQNKECKEREECKEEKNISSDDDIQEKTPPTEQDIYEEIKILMDDVIWSEPVCMRYHMTPDKLSERLEEFALHCRCFEKKHENINDAKRHFCQWLQIQVQNGNNNRTADKNIPRQVDYSQKDYSESF